MVGQNLSRRQLFLHQCIKSFQIGCVVNIGHHIADLTTGLSQCRAPETVCTAAQIEQNEYRVGLWLQLRRRCQAGIQHR